MNLSENVIQLIRENEQARNLLKILLSSPRRHISPDLQSTFEHVRKKELEQERILSQLSQYGVLSVDGMQKTYSLPFKYEGGRPIDDPEMVAALSDAVVFAQADADKAQLLDHYKEKPVLINGVEGVLLIERGEVYYISRFEDQTPVIGGGINPTLMIRKASIPVKSIKASGSGLTIGNVSVLSLCYSIGRAEYQRLDQILEQAGVAKIHGNLAGELL